MDTKGLTIAQKAELYLAREAELDALRKLHAALLGSTKRSFTDHEEFLAGELDQLKDDIDAEVTPLRRGKKKLVLSNGLTLNWLMVHKVEAVHGELAAVRALKRAGLHKLLRRRVKIEWSVNREAVRNNRHLVTRMRSIRVISRESFRISPPS